MDLRKKLEKQIKIKTQHIEELTKERANLDIKLHEAQAYIQAIQDMMKHLPSDDSVEDAVASIRPGSAADQARNVLQEKGIALHITKLLVSMDREPTKKNRQALSGQLAHYVRQGKVFTRPAPNTFGLAEWALEKNGSKSKRRDASPIDEDVPPDFGEFRPLE